MKIKTIFLFITLIIMICIIPAGASGSPEKFVGNIWPNGVGEGVPEADFWNQVTPENAGKWASVEPVRDQMNWTGLDTAWAYSREREIPFRYHTLIWGQQYPAWLKDLSPEEQREEIEEWFALVSERYPDPEFIDVVNEPTHEIPVFLDALGGYGDTGWDWVITSYELARKYFPDSELHLNDYKLLYSKSAAEMFLKVVKLLDERDLIDGIGLQAHFLELAKPESVQKNLDLLASADLPLYITEFDLNIEDDIRQAEQWAALFPLFYEHPSVKGITLWGSRQNRMWQKNGYLIMKDDSRRVSMEWLDSYLSGADYVIPEYIPRPRTGENGRIRIETESLDDFHNLQVAGDVIAYVEGDSWACYKGVVFDPAWDTLTFRYAKGGGEESAAHIVFTGPGGYKAASVPLESTGDWGAFTRVSVPWKQLKGEYDLYLTFDGSEGIGNIDFIEFSSSTSGKILPLVAGDEWDLSDALVIQAEESDQMDGVESIDGVIAYLDDGDYIKFAKVDFSGGFTTLLIMYAKASVTEATLTFTLDSLENDTLLSFRLGETGGWDSYRYAAADFPEVTGTHDLYIRFGLEDTTGVGNFDWFALINRDK